MFDRSHESNGACDEFSAVEAAEDEYGKQDDGNEDWMVGYDAVKEVALLDQARAVPVEKSKCDQEVYVKEGTELSAKALANQLVMLPEIDTAEQKPVDMADADIREPENNPEETEQIHSILNEFKLQFISSGNALPPPAKNVVCDIDVQGHPAIAHRARSMPQSSWEGYMNFYVDSSVRV